MQDAQVSLQDQYDKLENYSITAPISGKVIQKTMKAGEKLDNSTTKTSMAIIADMSTLVFEISVDELDISDIAEGQEVEITADALEGHTFSGYVDNVSIVGTAQNGVTSYPVKVVVNDGEASGLIPGMNVNASIVVESRENVLTVPLSAVNRGNLVYVKKNGSGKNKTSEEVQAPEERNGTPVMNRESGETANEEKPENNMPIPGNAENVQDTVPKDAQKAVEKMQKNIPDGFEAVRVEVGLSDDNNVEIISGLSEGDIVLLSDKTSSSSNNQNEMGGMPGGGMPGGGGGMPGGGMPAGGGGGMPGGGSGPR